MFIGFIALNSNVFINDCCIEANSVNIFKINSLYLKPCDIKYIPDLCFPLEIEKNVEININIKFITKEEEKEVSHNHSFNIKEYLNKYPDTEEIRIGINAKSQIYIWFYNYYKCALINILYNKPIHNDEEIKHFNYRYLPKPNRDGDDTTIYFDYLEEALYDGSHDKLHEKHFFNYHNAGIPKKLKVNLSNSDNEWSSFFWFDEVRINQIFQKFYGSHPETKTDFIIRIDVDNKKYELSLYRQGLKEPVVIPETAYQLIVFKNKFEDFRSENYNQPRGAWIW